MPLIHREVVLGLDVPRLDKVVQELTLASRSVVRGMFDRGCVRANGQVCDEPGRPGVPGDVVAVDYDPATRYRPRTTARQNPRFRVVFEDRHLVVVEKAAGILTVPTARGEDDTLVHEVARHLSHDRRITRRAWVVHRLDRDTSGLLVFGKTREVAEAIKDQFEQRKPEREYAAIVAGTVDGDSGTFRSYLATDPDLDQRSVADPDRGKLAVTHFSVTARPRGATFVRVTLETGRRNQIRVHFAEAGHPVLGDVRYQPEQARHPAWTARRLALHARSLGFVHPVTGATVRFDSPLPAAFEAFLRAAR